jgi:hypothetical protein
MRIAHIDGQGLAHAAPTARSSVSALENVLNREVARRALYRPFDPESLRTDDTGPIQEILAYNMFPNAHFSVAGNKDALAGRFSDVTPLGFKMLYESFGAVGHMNGVRAAPRSGMPRPVPHVRTFLEGIPQRLDTGQKQLIGWRIVHVNYASPATKDAAARAQQAPGTAKKQAKKKKDAADGSEESSGGGSESEAEEASVEGAEGDEDAIKRADKKLLDKKANAKAAGEHDRQLTQTFNGGFTQMARDGAVFRDMNLSLSGSSTASSVSPASATAKAAYKELCDSIRDALLLYGANEAAFEISTPEQQYTAMLADYLLMHQQIDKWNDAIDPRPFGSGAATRAPFKRETHSPAQVLDMITAVTYYADMMQPEQRDLTRYFDMPRGTLDAVLSKDASFDSNTNSIIQRALADNNLDVMDLANMTLEDAREYTNIADEQRLGHVRKLFTESPDRFHFMMHAGFQPEQFRGFPFPELVFELDPEFCRPEVIFQLPLPLSLFTLIGPNNAPLVVNGADSAQEAIENMTRTLLLLASITKSGTGHVYSREAVADTVQKRMVEYTTALRMRITDTFTAKKTVRAHGVSLLPSGTLTPEGALRLVNMVHEQNRVLGVSTLSDWALMSACQQFDTLVRRALDSGGLHAFRDVFSEAYTATLTAFGIITDLHEMRENTVAPDHADDDDDTRDAAAQQRREAEQNQARYARELGETGPQTKGTAEMMGQIKAGMKDFVQRAADAVEQLQARNPEMANVIKVSQDEEAQGTANYLGNVPEDIIQLDDALQLYREISTRYARLALDFTHEVSSPETAALFQSRLWNTILEGANEAHTAFFESDNVDTATKRAREWFMALPPESRKVEFRMLYNVRPNANMRIFITESLSSPAVNASQNMLAMQLTYFGSLHACRWYINSNDPKTNILLAGDGTSGKSYILHVLANLSPQGVATTLTYMSNHAMHVKANNDGYLTLFHEAMHRLLHPNSTGKDGSASESGDAANFLKDRLTRGRSSVLVLHHDPKTKERKQLFFETSAQGVYIMCTNDSLRGADENVLSRFIVFSVPKPRDQAEGSSPTERVVDPGIEGQNYVASHYSERVTLQHRLLRFRYMYMEFMIKAGVIPDGFQTYGGRILIDNILNEVHEKYSIETRDPRRRKLTEEMARSMAGLYACFMGLGSPLAKWYEKTIEAQGGDLWTPEAFLMLTAPFMYIAKDHVIDALSLLETIWTPQYQQRILFTAAFAVAQLHHMQPSSFRILGHAPHEMMGQQQLQHPGAQTSEIDWRYICIEGESDAHINQRIAEFCSKFGIRAADVDAYFYKCSKQWAPLRHVYRVVDGSAGAVAVAPSPNINNNNSDSYLVQLQRASGLIESTDQAGEPLSDASAEVERIERQLQQQQQHQSSPRAVPPRRTGPREAVKLAFDDQRVERDQVVRREYVNPERRGKQGRRLCISIEFLMRHMPFDITKPETMETYVASDKSRPINGFPIVAIDPATQRPSYKGPPWGREATLNFVQRVAKARDMATLDLNSMSPLMRCVHDLLSNAYLEKVPLTDVEAVEYFEGIKARYRQELDESIDPAKLKDTYPWLSYVTSLAVGDYVLKSKNTSRYPEGRSISFYDLLRFVRLTPNPSNKRPIMRHNYARLSIFSKEMLAFEPLGSVAAQRAANNGTGVNDTGLIGALDRSVALNNAIKIGYTADIDYYEASLRMKSMAHPGIPGLNMSRLMSFPPFTYDLVRTITQELISNGAYMPVKRAAKVEFPEDDERLPLEYPTYAIVKRIREIENMDNEEAQGRWDHVTPMDDIYMLHSTVGVLNFRHLEQQHLERAKVVTQGTFATTTTTTTAAASKGPAQTKLITSEAAKFLSAFAPAKQRRKPPSKFPVLAGGSVPKEAGEFVRTPAGKGASGKTKRDESDTGMEHSKRQRRTVADVIQSATATFMADPMITEGDIDRLVGIVAASDDKNNNNTAANPFALSPSKPARAPIAPEFQAELNDMSEFA